MVPSATTPVNVLLSGLRQPPGCAWAGGLPAGTRQPGGQDAGSSG
jgi:hypothetical protein